MMALRFLLLVLVLCGVSGHVQGASSAVTATQQIGVDTEAPTVPSPVTAVPVAPTQIDVSWGASFDNFAVAGYQLYRDDTLLVTTSDTVYYDTDLVPDTLYSYYVLAFDTSGNFSSSSVTVATTTLAVPPPDPVDPERSSSPRSTALLIEESFTIESGENGARFSWGTNLATQFILRYGQTNELTDGTIRTSLYRTSHQTNISGLASDTEYFYEVYVVDIFGRGHILRTGVFQTKAGVDSTPPANVASFAAVPIQNDVFLSWQNPIDDDFAYVRLVRNNRFYPQGPDDGLVVYEGDNTSVTDRAAFATANRQYYTVFSYDSAGNRSSGAVTEVQRGQVAEGNEESVTPPGAQPETTVSTTSATMALRAEDVVFQQDRRIVAVSAEEVMLQANRPYQIYIPYSALPQHLKSIIVTIKNPSNADVAQSFLLRYNATDNNYQADIPAFNVAGESEVIVTVFDYTAAVVHEITIPVVFFWPEQMERTTAEDWLTFLWGTIRPLLLLVALGLGLWWFLLLLYRNTDQSKQTEYS